MEVVGSIVGWFSRAPSNNYTKAPFMSPNIDVYSILATGDTFTNIFYSFLFLSSYLFYLMVTVASFSPSSFHLISSPECFLTILKALFCDFFFFYG